MTKIHIVRTNTEMPDEAALEGARAVLFGAIDGWTEEDKKAWRRFFRRVINMEPGEMALLDAVIPRNSKFHRKFILLLRVGFDAWETPRKRKQYKGMAVSKDFEQFREDITIMAGFYEQTFDLEGRMKLKAKSISFAAMDDIEFERLYTAVADVLLAKILHTYAGRDELDDVIRKLEGFL